MPRHIITHNAAELGLPESSDAELRNFAQFYLKAKAREEGSDQ